MFLTARFAGKLHVFRRDETPPLAFAVDRVIQSVVEQDHVSRLNLQGVAWQVGSGNAESNLADIRLSESVLPLVKRPQIPA